MFPKMCQRMCQNMCLRMSLEHPVTESVFGSGAIAELKRLQWSSR